MKHTFVIRFQDRHSDQQPEFLFFEEKSIAIPNIGEEVSFGIHYPATVVKKLLIYQPDEVRVILMLSGDGEG